MLSSNKTLIIDFDSTFIQTETLDELARLAAKQQPDLISKIEELTNLAMEGKLGFSDALHQRLQLLKINRFAIETITQQLAKKITPSFSKNKSFILQNAEFIYIISGGFYEIIQPIVTKFGIKDSHILANKFRFAQDQVIGVDESIPLAHNRGKCKQIAELSLSGNIYMIGDGYTDYELKEAGIITKFYLFAENILRQNLIKKADKIIYSFDEFIEDITHECCQPS